MTEPAFKWHAMRSARWAGERVQLASRDAWYEIHRQRRRPLLDKLVQLTCDWHCWRCYRAARDGRSRR